MVWVAVVAFLPFQHGALEAGVLSMGMMAIGAGGHKKGRKMATGGGRKEKGVLAS
jgi:uncharacterized membrane-anchored protein